MFEHNFVVIDGNVIDGLRISGPFADVESADAWAELYADGPYDITVLYEPSYWKGGKETATKAWVIDDDC